MSEKWETGDKDIMFVIPFTEKREAIDVLVGGVLRYVNDTIATSTASWEAGMNIVYNDTSIRGDINCTEEPTLCPKQLEFVLNNKGNTGGRRSITLVGHECVGPCPLD